MKNNLGRSLALFILFSLGYMHSYTASPMNPTALKQDQAAQQAAPMTPEELAQWEQEVNKEIAEFVNTLTPEEQKQFDQDVQELTKIMSEMSEDELVKFIKDIFPEEEVIAPPQPVQEQPIEQPTPVEALKPIEKPKEPEVPLNEIEAAAKLLEDLLMHSERFIRKTQMIPELPGNIEQWVAKNKLTEWNADATWETLKTKIETLNHILHTLLEKDSKTKKYKFLGYLTGQETLYNNLAQLKKVLSTHEPRVEPPAFGLGTVSHDSRKAIRELLNSFAEGIYKLKLIEDIQKLLEKYQPIAKALAEEEEQARKRSLEESKRARVPSPKVEAAGAYGYGYGPSPAAYSPVESAYQPGAYPSAQSTMPSAYDYDFESPTPFDSAKPEIQKPTSSEEKKEEAAKDAQAKKEDGKAPAAYREDPATKRALNKFEKNLEEFVALLESSGLTTIYNHMTDNSPVQVDLEQYHLPTAVKKLKNNLVDHVKALKISLKKQGGEAETAAMQELRSIASEHKSTLGALLQQLLAIQSGINIKQNKKKAYKSSLDELTSGLQQFNSEVGEYGADSAKAARPTGGLAEPTKAPVLPAEEPSPTTTRGPAPEAPHEPIVALPRDVERIIERIDTYLETIDRTLSDTATLKNIEAHVKDGAAYATQETADAITKATNDLQAVQRSLDTVQTRKATLPSDQQKNIASRLKEYFGERMPTFQATREQIDRVIALNIEDIDLSKTYGYLSKDYSDDELRAASVPEDDIKAYHAFKTSFRPASLKNLNTALEKLQKTVAGL